MIKVNSVEASEFSLEEEKERIYKSMEKRGGKEFDFDARLQDAIAQVWQGNKEAREKIEEAKEMATEELTAIRDSIVCGCR